MPSSSLPSVSFGSRLMHVDIERAIRDVDLMQGGMVSLPVMPAIQWLQFSMSCCDEMSTRQRLDSSVLFSNSITDYCKV
jgi:hypothetical protein